jgi:putative oxygen-independent coproporphyrinogen III oxidase
MPKRSGIASAEEAFANRDGSSLNPAGTPVFPEPPCAGGIGALYLHIPFCVSRCRYCDFSTSAVSRDDPLISQYFEALETLADAIGRAKLLSQVKTAYIGGGTPTINLACLGSLAAAVRRLCPGLEEFTSEANPDSLGTDASRELASAGISRISLGVQSFNDSELARLGRVHDAQRARAAASSVSQAGLDLSCDIMCGIPLQTPESLARSLECALACGARHVSVYPLMVEDGTPLARDCEEGRESYPDDDMQADLMVLAQNELVGAGLERYEVASYALPGKACRHNMAYWTGIAYLGLGSSASSMLTPGMYAALRAALQLNEVPADDDTLSHDATDVARVRFRMVDPAPRLVRAVRERLPLTVEVETLTHREAIAEDMMLALRMRDGIPGELIERGRACGMGDSLDRAISLAESEGLAELDRDTGRLRPTQQGWLLGNRLYGLFWDLAHA